MSTLRQRIEDHAPRLSPADRALLDVVLNNPAEAAFLSAQTVSSRASVHVAAATRLAQKLGFEGYPDLRTSLQEELLGSRGGADRIRTTLAQPGDLLHSLLEQESRALVDAADAVPRELIERVAEQVLASRRIRIFARGNASSLADMLARRLRRFGLDPQVLGHDGRDLAEDLVALSPDDLVIVIALRHASATVEALLRVCRDVGATTVLLTDVADVEVTVRPDVVLAAPRGDGSGYQSLTVPMALANAVVLTVAQRGGRPLMDALARLDDLLQTFDD